MTQALLELLRLETRERFVQCLWCGETYEAPPRATLAFREAGCPVCGYVGWTEAPVDDAPSNTLLLSGRRMGARAGR
jgi:hypothetical protein